MPAAVGVMTFGTSRRFSFGCMKLKMLESRAGVRAEPAAPGPAAGRSRLRAGRGLDSVLLPRRTPPASAVLRSRPVEGPPAFPRPGQGHGVSTSREYKAGRRPGGDTVAPACRDTRSHAVVEGNAEKTSGLKN